LKYIETIREILLSHCFPTNLFFVYAVSPPPVEMWILPWELGIGAKVNFLCCRYSG